MHAHTLSLPKRKKEGEKRKNIFAKRQTGMGETDRHRQRVSVRSCAARRVCRVQLQRGTVAGQATPAAAGVGVG